MNISRNLLVLLAKLLFLFSLSSYADELSEYERCQLKQLNSSLENISIEQINHLCNSLKNKDTTHSNGALSLRLKEERKTAFNPYVITPHLMNYILPITYTTGYNEAVYADSPLADASQRFEAKMQISFKVPLNYASMFTENDALFFGMTMQSWWQVYSSVHSKPFRETNYQPEIFYFLPVNWQLLNTSTSLIFGLEHQSNGRELPISRSWNRIYMGILVEHPDWVLNLQPWWRIPENQNNDTSDPDRDDNPDIAYYMGYFELKGAYRIDQNMQTQFLIRHNINTHKGAFEIGFTFPIWGRLRGYLQYFNGYGESLIDYNNAQQRLGLGIALTDLL
ncbi:phospholipase A [Catenovulum sediminis]|uniref:Phospholipase A1 n=1 Tax=Catenovulum sediminis TaxID=1740262 RepID=A0ABV1RD10_9ALTE|nr:phospholipase A [Catenovulum sediminis]